MFTLVGYTQSVDTSGVLTLHAAIPDPHVRTQGNDIVIPNDLNNIILAFAGGSGPISRAQLQSPSLRRVLNPEIAPLDIAAVPATPPLIADYRDSPLPLDKGEFLDFAAAETGAAAQRQNGFVWLADGPTKVDTRGFFTVRVTAAVTLVAFTWTNGSLTFDQTLPAGQYAIVGARFRSATGLAFRFVIPGYLWRPGALMFASTASYDLPWFRAGNLGEWGTFAHNAPPTVDFCATGADAAETGEIDLVKVA